MRALRISLIDNHYSTLTVRFGNLRVHDSESVGLLDDIPRELARLIVFGGHGSELLNDIGDISRCKRWFGIVARAG